MWSHPFNRIHSPDMDGASPRTQLIRDGLGLLHGSNSCHVASKRIILGVTLLSVGVLMHWTMVPRMCCMMAAFGKDVHPIMVAVFIWVSPVLLICRSTQSSSTSLVA